MTLWSLSAEIPGGVVAPSIVLGALLGRIYAQLLPDWWPGQQQQDVSVGVPSGLEKVQKTLQIIYSRIYSKHFLFIEGIWIYRGIEMVLWNMFIHVLFFHLLGMASSQWYTTNKVKSENSRRMKTMNMAKFALDGCLMDV